MKDKVFSRYINKMYPELLNGDLYINSGGFSKVWTMSYDNCYLGAIVHHGGNMFSINLIDKYHSLKYVFGNEYKGLFLNWFNKEHEVILYSLLGDDCGIMFFND